MSAPVSTVKHDKESFRRYLEHTGVVDSLSKALSQLFERHEQGRDPEGKKTKKAAAVMRV